MPEQMMILIEIKRERKRQDKLHPDNKLEDMSGYLTEEYLEATREWNDGNYEKLREELIHVIATGVRWIEMLDERKKHGKR